MPDAIDAVQPGRSHLRSTMWQASVATWVRIVWMPCIGRARRQTAAQKNRTIRTIVFTNLLYPRWFQRSGCFTAVAGG